VEAAARGDGPGNSVGHAPRKYLPSEIYGSHHSGQLRTASRDRVTSDLPVVDPHYHQILTDPIAAVEAVYAAAGCNRPGATPDDHLTGRQPEAQTRHPPLRRPGLPG
jgi:hypothetical protein